MLHWYKYYFYGISFFLMLISLYFILLYLNIPGRKLKKKYTVKDVKKIFGRYPNVLFIIPAYNESKVIEKTVRKIAEIEYPKENYKILVVDDGSKDNTFEIVSRLKNEIKNLIIVRKENGGKSSAINFGLKYALKNNIPFDFFVIIDADTYVSKDFLSSLVLFKDPRVYAVSVKILPEKPRNFVEKLQVLEYAISNLTKVIYSHYESWMIANTGTIFRKEVIKDVGFFDETDITEDLEYGLRIVEKGYKIDHASWVVITTEVPKTIIRFIKQRIRWYYGWFLNAIKHKKVLLNPKNLTLISLVFVYYNLIAFFVLILVILFDWLRQLEVWAKIGDVFYLIKQQLEVDVGQSILITTAKSVFWLALIVTLLAILFHFVSSKHNKIKNSVIYVYLYLAFYWIMLAIAQLNSLINLILGRKKWWR